MHPMLRRLGCVSRSCTLERLEQRYHRVTLDTYDYQAPRVGYAAPLQVSDARLRDAISWVVGAGGASMTIRLDAPPALPLSGATERQR